MLLIGQQKGIRFSGSQQLTAWFCIRWVHNSKQLLSLHYILYISVVTKPHVLSIYLLAVVRCGEREFMDAIIKRSIVAKDINHRGQGLSVTMRKLLGDFAQVNYLAWCLLYISWPRWMVSCVFIESVVVLDYNGTGCQQSDIKMTAFLLGFSLAFNWHWYYLPPAPVPLYKSIIINYYYCCCCCRRRRYYDNFVYGQTIFTFFACNKRIHS